MMVETPSIVAKRILILNFSTFLKRNVIEISYNIVDKECYFFSFYV